MLPIEDQRVNHGPRSSCHNQSSAMVLCISQGSPEKQKQWNLYAYLSVCLSGICLSRDIEISRGDLLWELAHVFREAKQAHSLPSANWRYNSV